MNGDWLRHITWWLDDPPAWWWFLGLLSFPVGCLALMFLRAFYEEILWIRWIRFCHWTWPRWRSWWRARG